MSKRQDLSAKQKCDLLKSYDMLPKISLRDAAARLNVSHCTLNRILKNRSNIERAIMDNESDSRKRKRAGKEEVVDKALKEWFLQVRKKDARINGPLLRQKAEDLAKKMGKDDFVATEGWFQRWKKRENISFIKTHGEQGEADFSAAQSWFKTHWTDLLSQYSPSDIFNADETGLYFRALPEHTYALKLDKAKGAKTSKERLTIMCCVSMNGEKRKLMVIGKSQNPRCFKGVKTLPVDYKANKNAWMTAAIFKDWLINWDKVLNRNILLLIDNCPAHIIDCINLRHIKVIFLPANTTSIIQPCDQGIIRTFKAYYRSAIRGKVLAVIDSGLHDASCSLQANDIAKKITILDAIHLAKEAWNKVSVETIRNCFRHGGFKTDDKTDDEHEHSLPEKPVDLSDEVYGDWVDVDSHLDVAEIQTEEEICNSVMNPQTIERANTDDEEENSEAPLAPPSNKEIVEALSILRRAVQHRADERGFEEHYSYENMVMELLDAKKQTSIDKYFK